jgi:hypothetical protein
MLVVSNIQVFGVELSEPIVSELRREAHKSSLPMAAPKLTRNHDASAW